MRKSDLFDVHMICQSWISWKMDVNSFGKNWKACRRSSGRKSRKLFCCSPCLIPFRLILFFLISLKSKIAWTYGWG